MELTACAEQACPHFHISKSDLKSSSESQLACSLPLSLILDESLLLHMECQDLQFQAT